MDDEAKRAATRTLGPRLGYAPTATPDVGDVASAPTMAVGSEAGQTRDLPASDAPIATGEQMIGHFTIRARLGEGGMGVVYAGVDADLGRQVAIKLVREQVDGEAYRARLLREAQAMARLEHPNVVRVYEVGSHAGRLFVAMELVDGDTLSKWLATPRDWRAIVEMFAQVGAGLSAVHRAGLVHRDFKPDNVLVDRAGHARVADFGLARLDPATATTSPMQPLTRTGAVMGTPGFMAPEQQFGGEVDARADQYSYCVALREAFGKGFPGVPAELRAVVTRGLSYDADERFASMDDLLLALARATGVERTHHRGAFVGVGLAVVVIGAITAVAIVLGKSQHDAPPPELSAVAVTTPVVDAAVPVASFDAAVAVVVPRDAAVPVAKPKQIAAKLPAPVVGPGSGSAASMPAITPMPEQHKLPAADVDDPGHIAVVRSTIRDLGYDGIDLAALDRDPKAMKTALEAERDAASGADQLVANVKLGMVARRTGDCGTASTLFGEAKAKLPFDSEWNARAWAGLAMCSLATKDAASALDQIQHSWNHGNQDEVFLAWGVASYELGDKQTALGMFVTAKQKTNARVQAGIARWLAGTGLALP